MDTQLKAKWVEALRSGEYEQGTNGFLRDGDNFCCLGVLCDIQGVDFEAIHNQYGSLSLGITLLHLYGGMGRNTASALVSMNDRGTPFSQIADYIEENL